MKLKKIWKAVRWSEDDNEETSYHSVMELAQMWKGRVVVEVECLEMDGENYILTKIDLDFKEENKLKELARRTLTQLTKEERKAIKLYGNL